MTMPADTAPHTNGSPPAPVSAVPARQMPHQESEAVKNELANIHLVGGLVSMSKREIT